MRTFLKIVAALVVLGIAGFAAVMVMTSNERALGKYFVTLASSGSYDQARALLHPALQEQFPPERMKSTFDAVAPYTEVSFSSIETSGSETRLSGSATTASGCASKVSIEVLQDQIIAFQITPLCGE